MDALPLAPDVTQALIDKLTLVAALAWGVVAFARGWIVPGSALANSRAEATKWAERHDKLADIAQAALRKVSGTL